MLPFLKRKAKTLTGMDIGSSVVKCMRLDLSQEPPLITHFAMTDLAPEAIVDGEIMDRELVIRALQDCAEKADLPKEPVATAVSGRAVIVKKIVMDKMSEEDAREAIFWEAEQHVPFDIDDITLDFQILDDDIGAGQMEILLVAAKKDMVQTHAELIRDAGFMPTVIEVASFANQNAWEFCQLQTQADAEPGEEAAKVPADIEAELLDEPPLDEIDEGEEEEEADDGEFIAMLDVGGGVTNVHIVKNGVPYFTRDLPIGTSHFVEEFQKQLGLTYETANAVAHGSVDEVDAELVTDIVRSVAEEIYQGLEPSLSYLKNSGEADGIDRIVMSGGGARLPGLSEHLAESYDVPSEIADPLRDLDFVEGLFGDDDPDQLGPMLTVSVGLALRKGGER
ncbi:type IV pilus assembly protein PilM [bacterium]|nr:type IV pilus assembly protein PilM [bacterium]